MDLGSLMGQRRGGIDQRRERMGETEVPRIGDREPVAQAKFQPHPVGRARDWPDHGIGPVGHDLHALRHDAFAQNAPGHAIADGDHAVITAQCRAGDHVQSGQNEPGQI